MHSQDCKEKETMVSTKTTKRKPKVEYYPSPGTHYFTYKGKKMWAFQSQGKTET